MSEIMERTDALGIYGRIGPGVCVRLPILDQNDNVVFVTGILEDWEPTDIFRGYTWDISYRFKGQAHNSYISVIINPGVPEISLEPYWTLADSKKQFKLQLVIPETFYMSVDQALNCDGPIPENESPLAY